MVKKIDKNYILLKIQELKNQNNVPKILCATPDGITGNFQLAEDSSERCELIKPVCRPFCSPRDYDEPKSWNFSPNDDCRPLVDEELDYIDDLNCYPSLKESNENDDR